MKKRKTKHIIIGVSVVLSIVLLIVLSTILINADKKDSYKSFIINKYNSSFFEITSETQRKIRQNILDKVFLVTSNQEQFDKEKLALSSDEEKYLLQNLNLIKSYFDNSNNINLNEKDFNEFDKFKNQSIESLDNLNELIKSYNSVILSIEELDNEFYLRTQEFFTKPIEDINSYIINIKTK